MGRKILVVDDDAYVQEYIRKCLENWGYTCTGCDNGHDVIAKVTENPPDLILLDVMLPDMDGITICRRLRSNPKSSHIPIIMVTSLTDATTIHDAHLFGAADYLPKPFEIDVLKSKVEKMLALNPAKPDKNLPDS